MFQRTTASAGVDDELVAAMRADAEEAARRTLRYKFGRLSNRKIVARVRAALAPDAPATYGDDELLEAWFGEYERALRRLRLAAGRSDQIA